jgi:demethylmenaquinone methyltransferase/2-methoxy-6-polyprenyl-1,4-benzoquinol methylase
MPTSDKTTHFGYQQIPEDEKTDRVRAVFDSVVNRYDLMNDLMSFGIHRLWKQEAISLANVKRGQHVLDLAAGTGDLSIGFSKQISATGSIIASDINAAMLKLGRDRLTDQGIVGNIDYVQADAEKLPFIANQFDCVSIGFGLRNLTHKEQALAEMFRVLRTGGCLLILEFSRPIYAPLSLVYDFYSFQILPKLGWLVTGDEASYRYLAESIRVHPDQESLKLLMQQAGFEHCDYTNLTGGIVAVHRGYKP